MASIVIKINEMKRLIFFFRLMCSLLVLQTTTGYNNLTVLCHLQLRRNPNFSSISLCIWVPPRLISGDVSGVTVNLIGIGVTSGRQS